MTKQAIRIYLEFEDVDRLKQKAQALGFTGRGSIGRYIEKIARDPIIFADENLKLAFRTANLKI